MNSQVAPAAHDLRSEAESLEHLLQSYVGDRQLLTSKRNSRVIYFIDAHDISSYIDPNSAEYLTGFVFQAERAWFSASESAFELEMKLRNAQVLDSLLFDYDGEIGLLPSHAEEVDEEIAFKEHVAIGERIALLDRAREEVEKLRADDTSRRLLALATSEPGNRSIKLHLVRFFQRLAPALMMLLRPRPADPLSRIETLVNSSNLVRLEDMDWKRIGFDEEVCERLKGLTPDLRAIRNWRGHLSERRPHSSNRANRIDGEAIAFLQTLNEYLASLTRPPVVARLVTRAMRLIDAAHDKLGTANFLRHPRLLPLNNNSAQNDTNGGDAAENALIVALRTYRQQLGGHSYDAEGKNSPRLNSAIGALVTAWRNFEAARFTIQLRGETRALGVDEEILGDLEFRQLLEWFSSDADVIRLVNDELRKAVEEFGYATFVLGRVGQPEPIQARLLALRKPGRVRVLPMVAGSPGPVDLRAPALRNKKGMQSNIEDLLSDLESSPPERYVAWALLFACRRRWRLANIYARSAVELADLTKSAGEAWIADEARLLLAQITRLGVDQDTEKSIAEARRRYDVSETTLSKVNRSDDPRVARERAAQILELQLSLRNSDSNLPSLNSGMELLHRALQEAQGDDLIQTRIFELGLTYHLAAQLMPELWPEQTLGDRAVARRWHSNLRKLLTKQRREKSAGEISRRARAMELIAFQILDPADAGSGDPVLASLGVTQAPMQQPLRIPVELRLDARDVRDQIKLSADATARLIVTQLDPIVARIERHRQRDLIYAPIWASHKTDWILDLVKETKAHQPAEAGYELLGQLTGATQQLGVLPEHRPRLVKIAGYFKDAVQSLGIVSGSDDEPKGMFYLRMEFCYAQLLLSTIAPQAEREAILRQLAKDYASLIQKYPRASIPHFRLSTILSALTDTDGAFTELTLAVKLVKEDPFLQPSTHWVRSTMQRRVAGRFSSEAAQYREQFRAGELNAEMLASYLKNLTTAFTTVYGGFQHGNPAVDDFLYRLESRRRINNIVYYAGLVLEACPESKVLEEAGFSKQEMRRLLQQLHPDGLERVTELFIVHTIGFAYHILGEGEEAARAGKRLMQLVLESGEDPKNKDVASMLADGFSWLRKTSEFPSIAVS